MSSFKLKGDDRFETEVVGELEHQDDFEGLFGPLAALGEPLRVEAVLVYDVFHSLDPNVVRVDVAGRVMGYLPKDIARRYRQFISRLGMPDGVGTLVDAQIVGIRPGTGGGKGHYAIRLDLPSHLLTTGQLAKITKKFPK